MQKQKPCFFGCFKMQLILFLKLCFGVQSLDLAKQYEGQEEGVRIKGLKLRRNSDWTGNWSGTTPGPRPPLPRHCSRGHRGTQILLTQLCTPP